LTEALLNQYVIESRECLEAASDALLELEKSPDSAESIDHLFRALHTLKGNAALFAFIPIVRVTHVAEDILSAVRQGHYALSQQLADQMFLLIDQVGAWVDAIESTEQLPADADDIMMDLLAKLNPYLAVHAEPGQSAANTNFNWISQLPDHAWFTPAATQENSLAAVVYTPDEGCFFTGDDPLLVMQDLPGICALHVEPVTQLPPLAELEIYQCRLRFLALSTAILSEVKAYCAPLYEQAVVQIVDNPHAESRTQQQGQADQRMFAQVIAAQLKVLESSDLFGANRSRLEACMQTVANTLRYMKMPEALAQFESLREAALKSRNAAELGDFLAAQLGAKATVGQEAAAAKAPIQPSRFVKVEQAKIDQLLNLIGEMTVAKNSLLYLAQQASGFSREFSRELKERFGEIEHIAQDMQDIATRIRMTPLSAVFQRLPKLVRDLARELNRQVRFSIEGEDTEADKNIIEVLAEPLLHMLRNSIVHGVESPEERIAADKNAEASISIRAFHRSDNVIIEVHDDGRGIDPEQVKRKAVASKLLSQAQADGLDQREVLRLIFMPGFSTTERVTDVAGRGVGMDVVKSAIERAGGSVEIGSTNGADSGTTVTLTLPLFIVSSQVMTIRVADQLFGIPMMQVRHTLRLPSARIRRIKKSETFVHRDEIFPLLRLHRLLNLPAALLGQQDEVSVLLVHLQQGTVGLVVDDFSEPMDVVLKPMSGILRGLNSFAGSALLADGSVLLILDLEELLDAH